MTRARRSHPPALRTLVARALRTECQLLPRARILVAVSGGGDSQALLHALATLRDKDGFVLFCHGVDHGLRAEAAGELDLAEALARTLDVPFDRSLLRVSPGGNLMARARKERYAALRAKARARGAEVIATAHHADDRAETVLLRLLRGAGPRGLAVLPVRDGDLCRPMLRARRTDVQAHLARHGLAFASDPSNRDPRFLRTRVRNELLPLLERLSPRVVEHLNLLADQLAEPPKLELSRPDGEPLTLGRAQVRALTEVMRTNNRRAEIWLPDGLSARYDPEQKTLSVGPRQRRGAANRRKSD